MVRIRRYVKAANIRPGLLIRQICVMTSGYLAGMNKYRAGCPRSFRAHTRKVNASYMRLVITQTAMMLKEIDVLMQQLLKTRAGTTSQIRLATFVTGQKWTTPTAAVSKGRCTAVKRALQ
jgi:hypothetical protein